MIRAFTRLNRYFLLAVFISSPVLLRCQLFHNLNFEKRCDSSKTGFCEWKPSWGERQAFKPVAEGKNNYLLINGKQEQSVGFVEQEAILPESKGIRIIKITADIKTDSVAGRGAGINVGIYDSSGALVATRDMGGFYSLQWVKGTKNWQTYTIETVCPENGRKIKLGAILYGKGSAGFDNYSVKLVTVKGQKASKLAKEYITAAIDTILAHSLVRDSLDTGSLKSQALEIAGNARNYRECHLAITYLLEALRPFGDHHSFFMSPEEVRSWENASAPASGVEYCTYKRAGEYGYISVPPFHGGNPALMKAYSDSLQNALRVLNNSNIKGWIVDLRNNTGGNMTPMIAGIGPLFNSEKVGFLVDVNGKKESWGYSKGHYIWEYDTLMTVQKPVELADRLPIAVLTGPRTGSSGETIVISFIGNAKTRSFGEATWGLTTGNGSFDLPDGARMMLASTHMVDRNGKVYSGRIEPDEKVEPNKEYKDNVLQKAMDWLNKMNTGSN
jgi:carboxyl-terminal processing protease